MWDNFMKCFKLPPELRDSAYANFIAWEKLRLYYNGALAAVSLVLILLLGVASGLASDPADLALAAASLAGTCILGTIAANLAFCVGPVVEGYLVMFRVEREVARMLLFVLGIIAGSGLAFLTVASIIFGTTATF